MPSVCLLSPATRQTAGLRRSPQWLLRPLPGSGWKESSTASSTRRPVASPPWWALFLLGSRQEPSSSLPGVCLSPSYSAYRTGGGCPRGHGVYETSGAHQGSQRAFSFKVGWGRARNASFRGLDCLPMHSDWLGATEVWTQGSFIHANARISWVYILGTQCWLKIKVDENNEMTGRNAFWRLALLS